MSVIFPKQWDGKDNEFMCSGTLGTNLGWEDSGVQALSGVLPLLQMNWDIQDYVQNILVYPNEWDR